MRAEAMSVDQIVITESQPGRLLDALHDQATPELEHLFGSRPADVGDLVLIAWAGGEAVGYLASSTVPEGQVDLWEHAVVPSQRQRGIGRSLLYEMARRVAPGAIVRIDPVHQLDLDRVADYYVRCGFTHTTSRDEIWATGAEILRATGHGLTGARGDPVRSVLAGKAPGVITIDPMASVGELIELLDRHRIGAVPMSSDGLRIAGIVSERDLLHRLANAGGADDRSTPVGSFMTTDVVTCTPSDGIELVMSLMTRLRIRHLPVVEAGKLTAMLSIGDVVRHRLHQLETENQQIRDYIVTGR